MKIAAVALAFCCLIQTSVASRLGRRKLQGDTTLPWNGPDYEIGTNGLDESEIVDTSAYGDVLISLDISHVGLLEDSGSAKDTLQVYYKVDDKPEEIWLDIAGDQHTSSAQIAVASGSQLTIRTSGKTSSSSESYHIRKFAVTEITVAPVPVPTAQVTPAPIAPTPAATCQVPWDGPDYEIDDSGLEKVENIDTSCVTNVLIAMDISHVGSLEESGSSKDTLQVYYKVDDKPEELWLDIAGDQYSSPSQIKVASGSELFIRIVGDTSVSGESYQIRNFAVTEAPNSDPVQDSECAIPQVSRCSKLETDLIFIKGLVF